MNRIVFMSVMILLLSCSIVARTLRVPDEYIRIQAAIWEAVDCDTVLVADGTFTGSGNMDVDFQGKAIVVRSENGPEQTVIDCEEYGRGFYFHTGEDSDSRLEGFTVSNGFTEYNGGGIYCLSASPTIRNCVITNNTASSGGGVCCAESSSPHIVDCVISQNETLNEDEGGGGILCDDASNADIENCSFYLNEASYGGGIHCVQSSPTIDRSRIMRNASSWGGGISCGAGSAPVVTNSILASNSAIEGGGGIRVHELSPTITNCTITRNTASTGGGISCAGGSAKPVVTNCILWADLPQEIKGGNSTVKYSDVDGGWSGQGNIDADPLFLDPVNEDFHIPNDSPCVDVGTDAGVYHDIDGDTRPLGDGFDMGADEVRFEGPRMNLSPSAFIVQGYYASQVESDTLSVASVGTEDLLYNIVQGSESWLALTGDLEGSLAPEETENIVLNFDLSGMFPGVFRDTITVLSNDPDQQEVFVPVTLAILSPVTVEVFCADPYVRRGEKLTFDVTVENRTDEIQICEVWLDAYLLGGEPYPGNPLDGPARIVMGPNIQIDTSYTTSEIPPNAPIGGPYRLCVPMGRHPHILVEDCFDFYVIP